MGGACSTKTRKEESGHGSSPSTKQRGAKCVLPDSKGKSKTKTAPLVEPKEVSPVKSARVSSTESQLSVAPSPRAEANESKKLTAHAKVGATKVSNAVSRSGKAGNSGLGKTVEVFDTLGSKVVDLNRSSGFTVNPKGSKLAILAFEVANTIVKGFNLMQSLSEENMKHLKEVVLRSEGVQHLISKDVGVLLCLVTADKRQELKLFAEEVVRFGNRCKDPQWHNLNRYFTNLELTPSEKMKETATREMKNLMTLVHHTAELYHELHALDRYEKDYQRKLREAQNFIPSQKGDTLEIFKQELKGQRKYVKSLQKKSLWNKVLEEVVEKLVDIVHFLHLEIQKTFAGAGGDKSGSTGHNESLGSASLELHYANIITHIDTLVTRSSSVPPTTRDSLYQALPMSIKSTLPNKLQPFRVKEELSVSQIKAEMEKTLQWLVPIANNTTRAHQGFGCVGEWATSGNEVSQSLAGQPEFTKIETLHHADKEKTEEYILDLLIWLHHLISKCRPGVGEIRSQCRSPVFSRRHPRTSRTMELGKYAPAAARKSLEFDTAELSSSRVEECGASPEREGTVSIVGDAIDRNNILDEVHRGDLQPEGSTPFTTKNSIYNHSDLETPEALPVI